MFTPQNQKKLGNVSVVMLKRFGRRYEVAAYPNKLYEYQKGMATSLDEVLQTRTVYRNVSKGEIASRADLGLFGKSEDEIVREILDNGHEQKNEATRAYEHEMTEREIVGILQNKVTLEGRYVSSGVLRDAIHKVHKIQIGNSKKQSQEILSKLEAAGFCRVGVKVSVEVDDRISRFVEENGETCDGYTMIRGDRFPEFKELCARENIRYSIVRAEEVSDEEIC